MTPVSLSPCSTPVEIVTSALRRRGLDPALYDLEDLVHDLRDVSAAPLIVTCASDVFLAVARDNLNG